MTLLLNVVRARSEDIIIFITPMMSILLTLIIIPLVYSLWISLCELNLGTQSYLTPNFIGLSNYIKIFTDTKTWNSFAITLEFVSISLLLELGLGLLLALALSRIPRGATFYKTVFLLPLTIAPALAAALFKSMLNNDFGVVNRLMEALGFQGVNWLSDPNIIIFVFVLLDLWQNTPFAILVFYAGLNSIPRPIYDASELDGASSFQILRHITFPLLKRIFLIVVIVRGLTLFQTFDYVHVLTGGGPGYSSQFISWTLYIYWIRLFNFGVASALSWIILLLSIPFILYFFKFIIEG
ncbi:MAG: sugar ABC transporter permease [Nitrososphaeria archaeon]